MSVCFIAGGVAKALQVTAFTLAWTHSVQKTDWQEDWQASAAGLTLIEARIKSSAAGVDPPPDARLIDGWWRWKPAPVSRSEVVLAHSGAAGDWRICIGEVCTALHQTLGAEAVGPITMQPCPAK
jgi:hypothetical protein